MQGVEFTVRLDPAALRKIVKQELTWIGYRVRWRDDTHADVWKWGRSVLPLRSFAPWYAFAVRITPSGDVCRLRIAPDDPRAIDLIFYANAFEERLSGIARRLRKRLTDLRVLVA